MSAPLAQAPHVDAPRGNANVARKRTVACSAQCMGARYAFDQPSPGSSNRYLLCDAAALPDLIRNIWPDPVIQTGLADGSSLDVSASMQVLPDLSMVAARPLVDSEATKRRTPGPDDDIRAHDPTLTETEPMTPRSRTRRGSPPPPTPLPKHPEVSPTIGESMW